MKRIELVSNSARRTGTLLGLFWIVKFILFPIGLLSSFVQFLFILLTLAVPFIVYYLVKSARDKKELFNGTLSFYEAFTYTLMVYFYASLLVAVAHYIYFQFIDHGFVFNQYQEMVDSFSQIAESNANLSTSIEQLNKNIDMMRSFTPIQLTFELMMNNLMWGFMMALPTAGFVMKKEKKQ